MSAAEKAAPSPAPDMMDAFRVQAERAMQRAVKGFGYLASSGPAVGRTPKDTLIARGTMQLHRYRPLSQELYRVPVLLVMATTNRGYILDLAPGQSLVEFLLRQGYDVFMLEWEPPQPHEKRLKLDDYVLDFLPAAVARVQAETRESDVSMVGYCAGGMLSSLYAAAHPDGPLKNLVCFTTPIDFRHLRQFHLWTDRESFDVDRLVSGLGNIPPELITFSFDMLRPATRVAGQARVWDNMWNDEFVASFRMFDRWATDALPLPGEYFRQTVKELFWENRLLNDTLVLGGRRIDLGAVRVPFLHVVAEHDHIVPREASAPLVRMVGSDEKEELMLKGGHVSVAAGGNAVRRLWPALDRWLSGRSV